MKKHRFYASLAFLFLILISLSITVYAGTQSTSGNTASDLISQFRQDVDDSGTNFVTDAEAVRWIDEAQKIIVSVTRCLEATENITLASGTQEYAITSGHFDIESVVYDTGDTGADYRYFTLEQVELKDLVKFPRELGRPLYFYEWNDKIGVWPVPGDDENGDTITLYLITKPTVIDEVTDSIQLPYYYESAILLYMKAKYHEKSRDEARSEYYRNLFYNDIDQYVRSISRRRPLEDEK
jgi:hypothetical protein